MIAWFLAIGLLQVRNSDIPPRAFSYSLNAHGTVQDDLDSIINATVAYCFKDSSDKRLCQFSVSLDIAGSANSLNRRPRPFGAKAVDVKWIGGGRKPYFYHAEIESVEWLSLDHVHVSVHLGFGSGDPGVMFESGRSIHLIRHGKWVVDEKNSEFFGGE